MSKLKEQCKLLKASLATMKQKIYMTESVIRASIAYGFYAVAFSLPTINKLDKILIRLQKSICSLPNCIPNITTQLPTEMFGLQVFSLRNAYLRCIGEQLRDTLNDPGKLGSIYQGLTNYIFAKNGGAAEVSRITKQACIRSPITRTLYLLKHVAGTHICSTLDNFPLHPTQLETVWLRQAQLHNINIKLCHHFLQKLLLYHITKLSHITLPFGTQLMTHEHFTTYYNKPTRIIKNALNLGLKSKIYPSTILSTTNIIPHETTFILLNIINPIYAYGIAPMAQLILNGLPNPISSTFIDVSIPFHFYSFTKLQDNANILNIPYSLTSLPTNIEIPNLFLLHSKYH
jgi:hypothetical protein